jgi:hypothetical protein
VDAVVILQPRAGDVNAGAYIRELARENSYLQRVAVAMTVREYIVTENVAVEQLLIQVTCAL